MPLFGSVRSNGVEPLDYGNGIAQVYTYNLDGQLESVIATGLGNIRSEYYTYDLAGNITGIANDLNTSGDRTFSYDPLNRLVSETYIGGERNYQYDAVGNRTQLIWARSGQSQETNTYTFEALSNRLIQKDTQLWTTDQLGNTLSAEGNAQTYTYDHANRLQSYSENGQLKATYHYNAQGQRVRTDKTEDTLLHYDQSGKYLGETNLNAANTEVISQIDYIYLDDFPVAQITTPYDQQGLPQKTRLTYLHTDHLNTPRIGTNTNQEIVWRWDSDAFGQQAPDTDPDTDNDITEVNLRFPGQIKGSESPHFYNYYRDYAPSLGRYLQSDPIGLAGGVNTFGYGYQNPIRNYDPDGRFVWILGLGALGGTGTTTAAGTGFLATGAILGGAAVVASIPGDTPIDRGSKARERKEYSRVCKTPIPPTGNPCTDARNNLSRLQKCLQLRENFSRKWYNDGDPGHITEIQNTRNAIKNLENWIRDHCGGQCE